MICIVFFLFFFFFFFYFENKCRYLHGGRDAGAHDDGFMDLWNLNFGHVTTMHVNNTESHEILDGRNLFSKIEIANGFRASSEFAEELEQCVVDLNVNVEIRHACLRDVSVWLINKGPKLQGMVWYGWRCHCNSSDYVGG